MSAESVGERRRGFRLRMPRINSQASNKRWRCRAAAASCERAFARCGKSAGDNVGIPVELFGRRVHDNISAQPKRPGKDRCGYVESMHRTAPTPCAISEIAAMSVIVHSGLLGVSIQNP